MENKHNLNEVLFKEDREKVVDSVVNYPFGSYQLGEVAKLSGYLYELGVDVAGLLKRELKLRKQQNLKWSGWK